MREVSSLTPIEQLRHLVDIFNLNNEGFNMRFTLPQLFQIYDAWMLSGWDIRPDEWSEQQLSEALQGIAPDWDEEELPVFSGDRARSRRVTVHILENRNITP